MGKDKKRRPADGSADQNTGQDDNGSLAPKDPGVNPPAIPATETATGKEYQAPDPAKVKAWEKAEAKKADAAKVAEGLWTVRRLLTETLPVPRWLVGGLIPEGLTLLVGAPKTGKSFLVLNFAIAWGTGGKALGQRSVERFNTLYLALEDTPQRLKGRLSDLNAPHDAALTFIPRRYWGERGAAAIDRLSAHLDAYPDTKVIIIDTLEKIRMGNVGDARGYGIDVAELDKLARFAEQGVSIIAIHHDRKGRGSGDILDRVSGTKGLTATADTILILDRKGSKAELHVTGRDVEPARISLAFDGNVGSWVELGNAWEYQHNANKQKVVDALKEAKPPLSPTLLASLTGLNRNHVKRLVQRMVGDETLVRVGRGSYALNAGQVELNAGQKHEGGCKTVPAVPGGRSA